MNDLLAYYTYMGQAKYKHMHTPTPPPKNTPKKPLNIQIELRVIVPVTAIQMKQNVLFIATCIL